MKLYSIIFCLLVPIFVNAQERIDTAILKESIKSFDYNKLGLLKCIRNFSGDEIELLYNDRNKISVVIERKGVDLKRVINYKYDREHDDKVAWIELEGLGAIQSIYDNNGRLIKTYSDEGHVLARQIEDLFERLKQMTVKTAIGIGKSENVLLPSNTASISIYGKDTKWKYVIDRDTNRLLMPYCFDYCSEFYQGIGIVKKDGKYGAITAKGSFILPMEYEYIGPPKDGLIRVSKEGKAGFVNLEGKVVLPLIYDYCYNFEEGYAKVKFEDGWNFINPKGEKLLSLAYGNVLKWMDEILMIDSMGKKGLCQLSGKILVKPEFDYISKPKEEDDFIWLRKERLWGVGSLLNNTFQVQIVPQYTTIDRKTMVTTVDVNGTTFYGLLGKGGQVLLEPIYDHIYKKYIGYFEEEKAAPPYLYSVFKGGKKGLFTPKQGFVAPIAFRSTVHFLESEKKDCLCKFEADSFNIICYDSIEQIKASCAAFVVEQNGQKGLVTSENDFSVFVTNKLPIIFKQIERLTFNSVIIKSKNHWKIFDLSRDSLLDLEVLSFVQHKIDHKDYEVAEEKVNQAVVQSRKGYHIVVNGQLSPLFFAVEPIAQSNYAIVKKGRKYGVFQNSEMKFLKAVEYDKIWLEGKDVFWKKGAKKGTFKYEFDYPFINW